jgi:hypothetical protein
MIDRCANSRCNKTLHYFREGIIYSVKTASEEPGERVEHFWLCGECARTVIRNQKAGTRLRLDEMSDLKPGTPLPAFEGASRLAS